MTERILQLVLERCGVDLGAYRAQTLERRVRHRMLALGLDQVGDYEALLASAGDEAERLLERVAIKVSRFYRNAAAFDIVARDVLPELATRHGPLSLWSAGCGRGEEAWTLAMLLDSCAIPGEVIATDLDAEALAIAREGTYPEAAIAELPARLRDRYLEGQGRGYRVIPRLRERVDFARLDLCRGRPEGTFHLVSCRNLLIYWARDVQEAILGRLLDATSPGGYVMLGESEWPVGSAAAALRETHGNQRIFRRIASAVPA